MQHNRLFTIGCSFTQYHWPTWADLLGREFEFFENWGMGSAGNLFIFNQLVECIRTRKLNSQDTVVVMWSSVNREDRYVNNKWMTSGNIHLSNIYGEEFTKKYVCEKGNLIRDLALISAAKDMLQQHNIEHYFLSAFDLTNSHANSAIDGIDNVLAVYQDVINYIQPSVASVIFNNWDEEYAARRRPRPVDKLYVTSNATKNIPESLYKIVAGPDWPSYVTYLSKKFNNISDFIVTEILNKEKNLKEDWHPTTLEHAEYLQNIFGTDILSDATMQYAAKATEQIFANPLQVTFDSHLPNRL